MCDKYNGWSNYETWAVNLWLSNEKGSYNYWNDRAQELLNDVEGDKDNAAYNLSQELKDDHEDNIPDVGNSIWSDLLNSAMSSVNWYEIAGSMLEDIEYESGDESEDNEE